MTEQERWLLNSLARPTARWNALAQQVFFSQRDFEAGPATSFGNDGWDNYAPERDALRDHLAAVGTSNPVILTGDVHANYLCDVKADFDDPDSPTVATEIVGTSISSDGDGVDTSPADTTMLAENPHIRFINHQRGYVRNVVTRRQLDRRLPRPPPRHHARFTDRHPGQLRHPTRPTWRPTGVAAGSCCAARSSGHV